INARVTQTGQGLSDEQALTALNAIEVQTIQEGETLNVTGRWIPEKMAAGPQSASAFVEVPEDTILELATSNADITVRGGTGQIHVGSANGAVVIDGHPGALEIDTCNGPIRVAGGGGRMRLRTTNHDIDIRASDAVVDAETINANIRFEGTLASGKHLLHAPD